jgi:alpha-L-rhamnosidase
MKQWCLGVAVLASLFAFADAADEASPIGLLTATRLTCEWLHEPAGVVTRRPRLAWQVESAERGGRQAAYRVLAASTAERLIPGSADLWDSGRVASSDTLGVTYAGAALTSGQQAFWRVQVWDGHDVAGPWSPVASWTMGLLDAEDWQAEWISARDDTPLHTDRATLHLPPARQYRKVFRAAKPVKRAVLHGTALGLVEWSLDGRRVGDHWFEPGWTDYCKRVPARTHDVTGLFTSGADDHCLAATVADGWYAGYVGYGLLVGYGPHRTGRAIYGKTPALRCRLDIEYADGSRETVVTDTSWQVTNAGPIREADLIMGETYDARLEMPGWNTAGFVADGRWQLAIAATAHPAVKAPFFEPGVEREVSLGFAPPEVAGYATQPIRVTQELPARSVKEQRPGVFVFDMGQNFAGVVRLKVAAPAGTEVALRFGEMLHPDGRVMTENLRKARATDTYICRGDTTAVGSPQDGDGRETWTPRFTYHGFQYVELSGLPAGTQPPLDTVTGLVLHNDMPLESSFACSDPVLTRFWENTRWTQRANFVEVPTDCPQRDERLGWMGDAQIYARTATFNGDVAAFFTKWLADVRQAQTESGPHAGSYPDYCPYPFAHGQPGATFGTAWTDAGVICPWTMWRVYGDRRLLEQHWQSMERFMAWRARLDPQFVGVQAGNPWGDWLNVGENTPIAFIDLCYHAQSARMMAEMAAALGRDAEAAAYRCRFDTLAASFARQHLRPDGTVAIDTQTACVLALDAGIVPEQHTAAVARQLAARIEKNGFRMATGFLGTKPLLPVLSAYGHHDLACRLFQSRQFPSWGYEVEQGATSVWERWDSFTREHGFNGVGGKNNAAMNSFSHYAFGAVMEWAFRDLAGIDALEPGYDRILIRPRIPAIESNPDCEPLSWARADYASPRGLIRSHWQRRDGGLDMRVTIPANTTARVHLPAAADAVITERGLLLADGAPGAKFVSRDARETLLDCGSGDYLFRVAAAAAPVSGDAVIRAPAGDSEIVITTTSRVAGAIHSLTWNGKEFIDSHDHGRQLQSASNFDMDGTFFNETFNPTEAGCERDMAGPTSTSRLLWLAAAGRELTTVNQMAFWLRPGQQSGGHPAKNTTALSNHLLEKHVTIGAAHLPLPARDHAIRYEVAFTVPTDERHTRGTFEALTGYMPAEFRTFHALAADGSLVPLDDGPGEQSLSVILSTPDGSHAMGVWSPDQGRTTGRPATYGRFWFEHAKVSKWNCVFRESVPEGEWPQPGIYRYLIWVAVGTREQVRDTLGILRRHATPHRP